MTWTNTAILSIVELLMYTFLLPLTVYTAYKHGRRGLLGHVYFIAYIMLRIIADGLLIANRNTTSKTSTAGTIVNSIGLSPLLLAISGFVSEAALYAFSGSGEKDRNKKLIILFELFTHVTTVTGVALLATGASKVATSSSQSEADGYRKNAEAGAILLLVSWIGLCFWAYTTLRYCRLRSKRGLLLKLLTSTIVSLLFLGARVVYAVVYTFDKSGNLSPARAQFAVELVLIFLVQLIAATALLAGLLLTINIDRSLQASNMVAYHSQVIDGKSTDGSARAPRRFSTM